MSAQSTSAADLSNPLGGGPEWLAERLGVPVATVYQWNSRGIGPKRIRVGKHIRYRVADVEAWIEAHTVPGGTAA